MAKGLTIMAMVIAVLVLLLFALDLLLGFPFTRASKIMDITFAICSLVLGYLSWSAFRDIS